MPELVELQKTYAEDLRVVAVSMDHVEPAGGRLDAAAIGAFAADRGFDALDIVLYTGDRDALVDGPWDLPGGLPFTLVLGADGAVVGSQLGSGDAAAFRALVEAALDG